MLIHNTKPFFSPVVEEDRFLPEGPRKLVGRDAIAWVNIQTSPDAKTGCLHVYDFPSASHARFALTGRPGFFIPTNNPDLLLCGLTHSVGYLNLQNGLFTPVATIPNPNDRVIINDGEVTPDGRAVVFGTKDTQFKEPLGHLYLFTNDGKISILASGMTCSNGKILHSTQGGYTLYDVDTPRKNVIEYELDISARTLLEKRVVLDVSTHTGFPDGMVDSGNGTAIIAYYNPDPADGFATRYNLHTGEILEQWRVPKSPRVTCPALIPRGNRVHLFLTTATEGMPNDMREKCPEAGTLFSTETELEVGDIQTSVFLM